MNEKTDHFSLSRFWAYLIKLLAERLRANKLRLDVLFVCLLVIEVLFGYLFYNEELWGIDEASAYLFYVFSRIMLVVGCLFASNMFCSTRKGEQTGKPEIQVTPLESWLARWAIVFPLFLLSFIACVCLADLLRIVLFGQLYPDINFVPISLLGNYPEAPFRIYHPWMFYFLFTSIYALGGVLFSKNAALKTTLWLLFYAFILVLVVLMLFVGTYPRVFGRYSHLLVWYGWLSVPLLWWLSFRGYKEMAMEGRRCKYGTGTWLMAYGLLSAVVINVCLLLQ